ncbi:cell adhesion molecule-related/down-regulated by oncogenes-like [Rhinoderma darwinii]|uniref:cell adhesion molecule-related/down-regulated by oncogenes-like n=1 Tax=Rhinoderma darwinii TaxID=43563 RepID=UPI003F680B47
MGYTEKQLHSIYQDWCFNKINDSYSSNGTARVSYQEEDQETKPLNPESGSTEDQFMGTECAPELEVDLQEKDLQTPPRSSLHDGLQEIKVVTHEGDGCSSTKEDGGITSPTPAALPIVLSICDENKTRTLDNSTNNLRQQLPIPEA